MQNARYEDSSEDFPQLSKFWGNKNTVAGLKIYLNSLMEAWHNGYNPWRVNSQLTPKTWPDIITGL